MNISLFKTLPVSFPLSKNIFRDFFLNLVLGTLCKAQGLLLVLCPGIIPGSAQENIWDVGYQNWVSRMQGKYPTNCTFPDMTPLGECS